VTGGSRDARSLAAVLDELIALPAAILDAAARADLRAARERLLAGRFNLVVLGEFKRGKSTLLNAILGRAVLPTGVVPLTSAVTVLRHGADERLTVCFTDGRRAILRVDELPRYVTEEANPANVLGVERTILDLPSDLLARGLQLVDTPGIGSIHVHNTEAAQSSLPRIDTALLVFGADQPVTAAERDFVTEVAARVPRILVAVNRIDTLEPAERDNAMAFVREALASALGGTRVEVFAVSARTGEGIAQLRDRLATMVRTEGDELVRRSVSRLAAAAAAAAAQAAAFEVHALELPAAELARRAERFDARIAALAEARAQARHLLQGEIGQIVSELVDRPLLAYAREHGPAMRDELRAHANELQAPPRELARRMDAWVDDRISAEFEALCPRLEDTVTARLEDVERRQIHRVEAILDEVERIATDTFGARRRAPLPQTGLVHPSRFTFKLRDVEHMVDRLVAGTRMLAPGALGRRLVVGDAETRLIAMLDRHAGRLRAELAERVWQAGRAFDRELATAVDVAIAAIREAVERTAAERRAGEEQTSARIAELRALHARCAALGAQVGDTPARDAPAA
jgi:small GTP-binding protein